MQAIVEINGKQYKVEQGRYIDVDSLPQSENDTIKLDKVNVVLKEDAEALIGTPYVEGASVEAKVLSHGRHRKVIVYKMRRKKGYRRKAGHRQGFTRIQIEAIQAPGA